uniref:Ig-like domain-containing protein n=1 Tax=Myripristis murdjan TaxID=586833 RepID=A0A667XNJ6_9TELE
TIKMDTLLFLLGESLSAHFPSVAPYQAVIEQVQGASRIFSGETVRLRCSVPEDDRSTWTHLWFRGREKIFQGDELVLWNMKVKHSGKYYCQGVRDTLIGLIHTLQSIPMEIDVDGGWAILQVPSHPVLVGETMSLTCRVRDNPKLRELLLYRDGVEVMRQKGPSPHFHLTNITVKDWGTYSCRATWDVRRRSHSVISVPADVIVLEVLTQPVLEVVPRDPLVPANLMRLICHFQYNAHVPAPPVDVYFYKDDERLTMASSEKYVVVPPNPGRYRCKAKVSVLGLVKWSESKDFGQVKETKRILHPIPQPRAPRPLGPAATPPSLTPPPAIGSTTAWATSQQPVKAPTYPPTTHAPRTSVQPVAESHTTVQPKNQTALPKLIDMSGDFPDSLDDFDVIQ